MTQPLTPPTKDGRSVPDGLSRSASSPQAVSPVPASIPSASLVWREAYISVYGCEPTHSVADYQAAFEVIQRAMNDVSRAAFQAGWRTNAVGNDTHSDAYLDGCEAVDFDEFQRLGLSAYLGYLRDSDASLAEDRDSGLSGEAVAARASEGGIAQ